MDVKAALGMATSSKANLALLDWYAMTATIVSNNAYVGGNVGATIAETSAANYRYLVADITNLATIKLSYFGQGWVYNVYFTDANNNIISKDLYRLSSDAVTQKTDVEITVPSNATKVYVNSMTWGSLTVKVKTNNKNSRWINKKCVCFGDSITGQGLWQPYVKNELGFYTMINNGLAGTSVGGGAAYPESVNSFWQDVRINALAGDTDCLIIMGGTNDGSKLIPLGTIAKTNYDVSTFVGAYNVMLTKIFYKYYALGAGYYAGSGVDYSGVVKNITSKNVKIFLVTPTFCADTTFSGADFSRMEGIANAVLQIGSWWHIPVIDNYHNAGINEQNSSMLLADGVHPNAEGAKNLFSVISGGLTSNQPAV